MGFLDDLRKKSGNLASRAYDQLNPLDGNRSWQQRTPTNNRSILGQTTHNGVTNTLGNFFVKPAVNTVSGLVVEPGRSAVAQLTNNRAAMQAAEARKYNSIDMSFPGFVANNILNTSEAASYVPDAIAGNIRGFQGKAPTQRQQEAYQKGLEAFNKTSVGAMVSPVQSAINSNIDGAKEASAAAGYDVNAPGFKKYVTNPALGALGTVGTIKAVSAPMATIKQQTAIPLDRLKNTMSMAQKGSLVADQAGSINLGEMAAAAKRVVTPKYAGLTKGEIIMDPKMLDVLNEARSATARRSDSMPTVTRQAIIDGLHQIKKQYGHDFINDNPEVRAQRITQFLEQNGEAIPKYQKSILNNEVGSIRVPGGNDPDVTARLMLDYMKDPGRKAPSNGLVGEGAQAPTQMSAGARASMLDSFRKLAKDQGGFVKIGKDGEAPVPKVAEAAGDGKLSRFANKTIQNSDEVSPTLKKMVKEENIRYQPTTNKLRLETADEIIGKSPKSDKVFGKVIDGFESNRSEKGQHVVNAIALAKKLDEAGDEGSLAKSTELYDMVSRRLTERGQEVQAGAVLSLRTPQGLKYQAIKTLRRGGVEVTPAVEKMLDDLTKKVKAAGDDPDAKEYAIKTMQKYVAGQIPSPVLDKMISTWKAGLLTGIKTVTGNAVSNASFRVGHEASKPLAVALDQFFRPFTGKSSQALTYKGVASGAGEGFQRGWQYFKTGIDERQGVTNKFLEGGRETNFKNPIMNKYVNGVFRNMAAQDRPFYYSQMRTSLNELARVEGKNAGLKGSKLNEFVKTTLSDPSLELMQRAKNEADKAVLAHDTVLGKGIGALRQGVNQMEPSVGKNVLKFGLETTMPFTGVPAAFVSRVLDFTPVGALKEVGNQVMRKNFDQRALTTALSEATTGTGLMWLGAQLAQNDMLSGPYPNDPREQARWKAEGITPNSIKVGDKWISLNYLGPAGMLFNAGARANQAKEEGGGFGSQVASAAGGAPKDLTQQSFLQGLSNAISAVNDPGRYLNNWVNSQVGSVIPTLVNDFGNATDDNLRERNGPVDALKSRIPGVRKTLPTAMDAFGNDLKQTSNWYDRMANPLRPSVERTGPLFSEVNRLHDNDLKVMLTPQKDNQTFDGVKTPLTIDQRRELQRNIGQNVQKLWNEAIESEEYKGLSDEGKANMLKKIHGVVSEAEKRKFSAEKGLGQYSQNFDGKAKNASADSKNYMNGTMDITKFAKESTGSSGSSITVNNKISGTSKAILNSYSSMDEAARNKYFNSTNDAEYQYLKAKYENDEANGELSTAEGARTRAALRKAEVGKSFEKNTRDLYSLSKDEITDVLQNEPNGDQLAQQILSYGDALEKAGITKNKFRDKNGNPSFTSSSRKSAGGRKRSAKSDFSSLISAASSASRAAGNAKVGKVSFQSKMKRQGLKSFSKGKNSTVNVKRKVLA